MGGDLGTNIRRRPPVERPETIPLAYAGKWLAWSGDGLRILAVGDSFEDCERADHAPNMVAIAYAPIGRVAGGG